DHEKRLYATYELVVSKFVEWNFSRDDEVFNEMEIESDDINNNSNRKYDGGKR
ncbi:4155_t:CDS:1, partial [Ambispora leptoticha]